MSKAPWTPDQMAKLTEYQRCSHAHPFTCPNRDDGHPYLDGDNGVLTATVRGWECQFCDYRQDWCHEGMLDGAPPNPIDTLLSALHAAERSQI